MLENLFSLDVVSRFSIVFTTLFVIIDPIGVVPTFLGLTKGYSDQNVKRTIVKAVVAGGAVLLAFSIFGTYLFQFLGLNINAFRAGGGLLLLLTALDMLRGRSNDCRCSNVELSARLDREDISFVPIAVPLLAGPGAITSIMVFSTDHETAHFLNFLIIATAVVICFLISFIVLRGSSLILKYLGDSGVSVIQRLMGLILAALSVQLIAEGVLSLFEIFKKS